MDAVDDPVELGAAVGVAFPEVLDRPELGEPRQTVLRRLGHRHLVREEAPVAEARVDPEPFRRLLGEEPRLFTEETSEGFWIHPGLGYRRFLADEMTMAEPAEYGLAWLAQFRAIEDLWEGHADGRPKFHGIVDRIHVLD